MSHAGRATDAVDVYRRHRLRRLHAGRPAPPVRVRRGLNRARETDRQHTSRDRGSNNLLHEELLQSVVAGRTAPGSGRASSPSRSVHRMRAISSRPAAPRSPRADEPGAGRGESRNGPTGATSWRSECCHRAPVFGALGEPAFYRAVGVDVADETPCAAPLPRESPSGAQSLLVPLPVSGPHRDNHPRSQGWHLSSSSPHVRGALIAV